MSQKKVGVPVRNFHFLSTGLNGDYNVVSTLPTVAYGMQAFNTMNPVTYAIKNASEDGGYGDYRNVDESVQITLAIHAASIGYRQFSQRLWNISIAPHGVQFNARF